MRESQKKPQVGSKFCQLIDELEVEVEMVNAIGAEAFDHGQHDMAQEALDQARALNNLRNRIVELQDEWKEISASDASKVAEKPTAYKSKAKTENAATRETGLMTPESTYYRPILEALVARGGSSPVAPVLEDVYAKVQGLLTELDHQPLEGNGEIRWRNRAKWARKDMVKDGRLKGDSRHGVWEISDRGREWLERQSD